MCDVGLNSSFLLPQLLFHSLTIKDVDPATLTQLFIGCQSSILEKKALGLTQAVLMYVVGLLCAVNVCNVCNALCTCCVLLCQCRLTRVQCASHLFKQCSLSCCMYLYVYAARLASLCLRTCHIQRQWLGSSVSN